MADKPSASNAPLIQLVEASDFLMRESADDRPFLVEGLIPAQSQTMWQGRPKVGKSHSLLQLAVDAAADLPVFGRFRVPRPVRTCYVELEEPEPVTKSRLEKIYLAQDGAGLDHDTLWLLSRNDLHRWGLHPRELLYERRQEFFSALRDKGIELLVIVALHLFLRGDPNESAVAEDLNESLEELRRETQAALLFAHHNRKSPAATAEARGLGSTMLAAHADAIFDFSRVKGEMRRVEVEARYEAPQEFFLRKVSVGEGEVICAVEEPDAARQGALEEKIAEGKSLRQAAKEVGMPYTTAHRLVKG